MKLGGEREWEKNNSIATSVPLLCTFRPDGTNGRSGMEVLFCVTVVLNSHSGFRLHCILVAGGEVLPLFFL